MSPALSFTLSEGCLPTYLQLVCRLLFHCVFPFVLLLAPPLCPPTLSPTRLVSPTLSPCVSAFVPRFVSQFVSHFVSNFVSHFVPRFVSHFVTRLVSHFASHFASCVSPILPLSSVVSQTTLSPILSPIVSFPRVQKLAQTWRLVGGLITLNLEPSLLLGCKTWFIHIICVPVYHFSPTLLMCFPRLCLCCGYLGLLLVFRLLLLCLCFTYGLLAGISSALDISLF